MMELFVGLFLIIFLFQLGLNVLIQKANKFSPATKVLIHKFVPFPAVGKCSTNLRLHVYYEGGNTADIIILLF